VSLWALTSAAVAGLKRTFWGAKIPQQYTTNPDGSVTPVEGGDTIDTGVQAAITELVSRLSNTAPIDMSGTTGLQLIAPQNAAGITLYQSIGNPPGNQLNNVALQFYNPLTGAITQITYGGQIINTQTTPGGQQIVSNGGIIPTTPGGGSSDPPPTGGAGFTGTFTVMTGATVSVSGCTATINATTSTVTMQNGQVTSVA
jgi:hypothetical protein